MVRRAAADGRRTSEHGAQRRGLQVSTLKRLPGDAGAKRPRRRRALTGVICDLGLNLSAIAMSTLACVDTMECVPASKLFNSDAPPL